MTSYLNAELLNSTIRKSDDLSAMLNHMRIEVDGFAANFHDDPKYVSQWGHHYFCQEDGGRLIFDLDRPTEHECSVCGTIYQNELLDGVWWYLYRNEAVLTIWKSALIFALTQDQIYLQHVQNILGFYADHYLEFPLHNKKGQMFDSIEEMGWGCGRILPQGLNESIIITRILNALELVRDDLPTEFLHDLQTNFFEPAYELLRPQVDKLNNIACWVNCAIGSMGLFLDDQEMVSFAFEGERNVRRQLRESVTADGFWYEGSIFYNFFTLEGVLNLLLFSKLYGYEFGEEARIVKKMLHSAFLYAFDNDQFPNPNDGWPRLNLKSFSYIYSLATKIFDEDDEMRQSLADILANQEERGIIPLSKPYCYQNRISLLEFIFTAELESAHLAKPVRKSLNYPTSNCGVIRNESFNVFHKYGHQGPAHAHPDKMNIEIVVQGHSLSRDLSNSGYGARLCNEWHRVSASHNTVVVDGENHISMEGGLVEIFDDHEIKSSVKDVYPGINYERHLKLTEDQFVDEFRVAAVGTHTYDYFFHVEAALATQVKANPASLGYEKNGYQHIQEVEKIVRDVNMVELCWRLGELNLMSRLTLKDGQELFIAKTFDNPASSVRTTLIIRESGSQAEFRMKWAILA
jgi:oligo-alginate lyase